MLWVRVIVMCGVLVMSIGIFVFGCVKLADQISRDREDIAAFASTQKKYDMLIARNAAVARTAPERSRLDGLFLNEKNVAGFLGDVELLGRSLGLTVSTTFLGTSQGNLSVDIKASGAFAELVCFGGLMERMPYRMSLIRMTVNGAKGTAWQAAYSLTIKSFE